MNKEKITPRLLKKMKERGEKIAVLTAYDWLFAKILEEAKVDILLVGDSCGMVVHGYPSTLPVTMDVMLLHTKAVSRAAKRAMVVGDMPFLSYQISEEEGIKNAGRFLQEAHADAVKLEGGKRVVSLIKKLVDIGIPVMGHLGLTPQSVKKTGYTLQAKEKEERKKLLEEAKMLEDAGIFSLVLEKVPSEVAMEVTESLSIPTIGIGAGPYCDGQVLVTQDMLGLFEEFKPKFVRRYLDLAKDIKNAVEKYIKDVKESRFPSKDESF